VYFVGLDLAWGERKPTGIAVIDQDGRLVDIGVAQDDASIRAALQPYVAADCLVAIDAPLVVTNPTGQRPAETALNRDFGQFEAGAHPANTGKPEFAGTPRGARLADALGLDMDPGSRATRRAIEVYPHPATVALFRLGRTLKYKHKPGRSFASLRSELLRLIELIEELEKAQVPLRVTDNDGWIELHEAVDRPNAFVKIPATVAGLPAIDFTSAAYVAGRADRFYVASDGGGTQSGGVWSTADSGQSFRSLASPIGSVTALALSAEDAPTVYTATFRPIDHLVMLWAFHDTGGTPTAPVGGVPAAPSLTVATAAAPAASRARAADRAALRRARR